MSNRHESNPDQLLFAARAGDNDALGRLLNLHDGYLTLLARVHIGKHLQAKFDPADVVQETFLDAHRDFTSFRGFSTGDFQRWLRQILAANLAGVIRRYLGTQRRDPRLERHLADEMERSSTCGGVLVASQSTPSEQLRHQEQVFLLANALEQMPPHYRDVIILHHLEGVTLAEVATRLGRTEDSVQKIWTRALIRLREVLGTSP